MILVYVSAVAAGLGVYLPSPGDADGWGLRLRLPGGQGPYLAGEDISQCQFEVTLINFSARRREHTPLVAAIRPRELELEMTHPDKSLMLRIRGRGARPDPFALPAPIEPRQCASATLQYRHFGYWHVPKAGTYQLAATLKIGGATLKAPLRTVEVCDVPAASVLASHRVPRRAEPDDRPAGDIGCAAVEQVRVRNRVLLVYRRFAGAKDGNMVTHVARLAELPAQVPMKVEGEESRDGGTPLTVTYTAAPGAKPTKLVVHSVDGTPWTEEDERAHREREKERRKGPAPAPKP